MIFFNSYFSALLFSKLKTYVFRTKEVIIVLVEMAELRRCDKTVWYPPNSHYFAPGPLERWLALLCPGPCVLTSEGPAVPPGRRGAWAATLRGTSFLHLPQPSAATFPSGSDVFIINRKSMRGRWYPPRASTHPLPPLHGDQVSFQRVTHSLSHQIGDPWGKEEVSPLNPKKGLGWAH